MTITECVGTLLTTDGDVTDIVPAERIKVPGAWQGIALPYIEHMPVTVTPIRPHGGLSAGKKWTYQVSVFASTVGEGEDLSFLVVAAMEGTHALGSPTSDRLNVQWAGGLWYAGREDENQIEHFVLQFEISQM